MERLNTSLQAYHINTLQEISEHIGLQPEQRPVRKDWLVRELSVAIPRIARSEAVIDSLSAAERAALAVALRAEDVVTFHDVAIPLMLAGLVQVEDIPRTMNQPTVRDVLTSLLRKGLIVNLTEPRGTSLLRTFAPIHRFAVPREVRSGLPASKLSVPEPAPKGLGLAQAPAHVLEGDLQQFLRELFFMWAELRKAPALRLKAGGMGKRDRRRIAESLGLEGNDEDLDWISQLYEVLVSLNLVNREARAIEAVDNDAVKLFWGATPVRQLQDLILAYSKIGAALSEEDPFGSIPGYYRGFPPRSASEIREKTLQMLGRIAGYGWISFEYFLALLTGGRKGYLMLDVEALEHVFDSLQWYGANYRNEVETHLQTAEYEVVRHLLSELYTLGLVDLGFKSEGSEEQLRQFSRRSFSIASDTVYPVAFRATEWVQQYYTGAAADRAAGAGAGTAPAGQVILQPDFQLLALGPVPMRVLANLEQFAAREKIDESVVTYRITRESVYRAFQLGESVETIMGYLEEATAQPVPQNVSRSLQEWSRQHERIVVRRQISLLQVNDPDLAERLLQDSHLSAYLHRLDERTLWTHAAETKQVEARLLALDVLPAHSKDPAVDLKHSLRWEEDELVPRAPLPSLYVTGTLRRFAELHGDRWRLTPETVREAVSRGADPTEIISIVEEMTGEPMPQNWQKRLKAWGSYFGSAQVAEVRLLRLARENALSELRVADERLRRWLHPLPNAANVAVVSSTHWDEVIDILASWGVQVNANRWW